MRTEPGEPAPRSPIVSPITDIQPSLELADVLRGQGIDDPDRASGGVVAVAQQVLDEAQALLAPAAIYTVLLVQGLHHQTVSLDGGVTFEGPLVARALTGAREVALAVCTIGPALEERVAALFAASHTLQALALDGAGTGAIGEVSQMVGARICDAASARGLNVGMRASPGQEGWSIWQQRILFGLVPGDEIGVRLTESCLMLPRKSVSFALGLGAEMSPDAVACDFCSKRERCRWRKEGIHASATPRVCYD
jgi:hypothetical protein